MNNEKQGLIIILFIEIVLTILSVYIFIIDNTTLIGFILGWAIWTALTVVIVYDYFKNPVER